jgi:Uma2 family endonuclease
MAFPQTYVSPEEYLLRERAAIEKSEYFNGQIYAMAGASHRHGVLTGNCSGLLWAQLRGKPCEVHTSDLRVHIAATGAYVYPDVSVACDPEVDTSCGDNLLNPKLIIEVLSRSTEAHDRTDKWAHYQEIPSLDHYLIIWQDQMRIVHYRRHGGSWLMTTFACADDVVLLDAIGCELRLSDVYERIDFHSARG